jgi:regulator of sigma E protease
MPELLHSLLSNVWAAFVVVLFFGGSIFVHELGHFLAARRRGLRVERFSIGFGPAIWSRRGRDGVEYRLSWLPLGGYVLLPQLLDIEMLEGKSRVDAAQLPPVSYASKMIVFAAGAFFNILFAFVLATILWIAGQPESADVATTKIGYVAPELVEGSHQPSPAMEAGLRIGDVVRAIDGHAVKDWNEMLQTLVSSAGRGPDGQPRTVFTIERNGRLLNLTLHPRLAGDNRMRKVGISPDYEIDVYKVDDHSPAAKAGFKQGDVLLAADGAPIRNEAVLEDYLESHWAKPVAVTIRREAQELTLYLPSRSSAKALFDPGLGVAASVSLVHISPFVQLGDQVAATFRFLISILNPRSDLGLANAGAGAVGIVRLFHSAAMTGLATVLMITVAVNISLAIANLLPIPILDGGQMLFATIARIRGQALPLNIVASLQIGSLALVASVMIYMTISDVRHWVRDVQTEQASVAAKP